MSERLISKLVMKDEIKSFKFGTCRLFLKQDAADMIGYCEEKKRQMKENVAKVYPGIPEEKEKGTLCSSYDSCQGRLKERSKASD